MLWRGFSYLVFSLALSAGSALALEPDFELRMDPIYHPGGVESGQVLEAKIQERIQERFGIIARCLIERGVARAIARAGFEDTKVRSIYCTKKIHGIFLAIEFEDDRVLSVDIERRSVTDRVYENLDTYTANTTERQSRSQMGQHAGFRFTPAVPILDLSDWIEEASHRLQPVLLSDTLLASTWQFFKNADADTASMRLYGVRVEGENTWLYFRLHWVEDRDDLERELVIRLGKGGSEILAVPADSEWASASACEWALGKAPNR